MQVNGRTLRLAEGSRERLVEAERRMAETVTEAATKIGVALSCCLGRKSRRTWRTNERAKVGRSQVGGTKSTIAMHSVYSSHTRAMAALASLISSLHLTSSSLRNQRAESALSSSPSSERKACLPRAQESLHLDLPLLVSPNVSLDIPSLVVVEQVGAGELSDLRWVGDPRFEDGSGDEKRCLSKSGRSNVNVQSGETEESETLTT